MPTGTLSTHAATAAQDDYASIRIHNWCMLKVQQDYLVWVKRMNLLLKLFKMWDKVVYAPMDITYAARDAIASLLIPPAPVLVERLRQVLMEFSQDKHTDPDSGKPSLDVVAMQSFLHFPIIPVGIVTAIRSSNCCCNMPLKRNYDGYATRFFLGFQALSDRPFSQ
ncbi:hypothetical protein MP228_012572 [Amoeboaphelidium protococcarum]|nr:hypothetical protein MP228_012572 [Amoeboaphelidium protococcarum]